MESKLKTTYKAKLLDGSEVKRVLYCIQDHANGADMLYDDDGSFLFSCYPGIGRSIVTAINDLYSPFEHDTDELKSGVEKMTYPDEVWLKSYRHRKDREELHESLMVFKENPKTLVVTEDQFELIQNQHSIQTQDGTIYSLDGKSWFKVKVLA